MPALRIDCKNLCSLGQTSHSFGGYPVTMEVAIFLRLKELPKR
jgi:hypothetical protein